MCACCQRATEGPPGQVAGAWWDVLAQLATMAGVSAVFDALDHVIFQVGGDAVSYTELFGFLTGGASVVLAVRAHVANFPVGLANSAFFGLLFLSAHLYANSALQLLFFILGITGWWQWLRPASRRVNGDGPAGSRPILNAPLWTILAGVGFTATATAGLTVLLGAADDPAPFWDALTTALSLVAQYLLNAKQVQTWWFWIAADVIYVPFYLDQHLTLTAIIYVFFLGLCALGLRDWRRAAGRSQREAADVPAVT